MCVFFVHSSGRFSESLMEMMKKFAKDVYSVSTQNFMLLLLICTCYVIRLHCTQWNLCICCSWVVIGIYIVSILDKYSTIKDWIQVNYSRLNLFVIVIDTWIMLTFISVIDSLDWGWTLMTWTTGSRLWPGTPVLIQSSTWVRHTLVYYREAL